MTSFLKYIAKHALRFLEKIGKRKSSLDESKTKLNGEYSIF